MGIARESSFANARYAVGDSDRGKARAKSESITANTCHIIICVCVCDRRGNIKEHAETEFEKYRIVQDHLFQSDFDKYLGELPFDGE
jgi:hypothetical protein